ncbi:uncharacterized protein OCT59_026351 [Rhizophagus irregularis]|nr:hypothetical protein OCT59_026351 [Rhizophagus irregularis]CAB5203386.1 unnamed protein product [Rhizophagus irregularis]
MNNCIYPDLCSCEYTIVAYYICLKCCKIVYIPTILSNNQIYHNGPTAATYYPNQSFLPSAVYRQDFALDELEYTMPNIVNEPEGPQATYPAILTTPQPSFTPAVDPQQRKVTKNKNRHDPYNIPTKVARNINKKKPINFGLTFVEDIEQKRPIPKKTKRVNHCFEIDSRDEIKNSVENIFPKLKNRAWEFLKCESFKLVPANIQLTISELEG